MLYQPRNRIVVIAQHALGLAVGLLGILRKPQSDGAYLDGMRASELEDLGLRRGDDGGYRFFK